MRCVIRKISMTLALVSLLGCGSRISDTERRQAQNRARLATSMLMEGEFASALREARRAVEIDPECVDCRITLATIYGARAEFDRAGHELERVLELDEENPFALNTLASVYLNTGRPAEAEPLAERAADDETYAGRHLAFYNLGWARQEQQDYAGALEAFRQALLESPQMCLAHYRVGEVSFRLRRFDDALQHLERAITEPEVIPMSSPTSQQHEEPRSCVDMPDVFYLLGLTFTAVSRGEEAGEAFERCVELATQGSELAQRCAQQLGPAEPSEGQE